ncbi:MAG: RecB family exonuclease, partial [Formosimonas sp.]
DLDVLLKCPYQFYTRQVLGLKAQDLPVDEVQAFEKGNLWHSIVADFHAQKGTSAAELSALIEAKLQPLATRNARYWLVREAFLSYVEPYVAWWQERLSQGWRVLASETRQNALLDGLTWRGTIDQVDVREHRDELTGQVTTEYALMDYKTGKLDKFVKKILAQEEVQLAFYLNLYGQNVVQAGYIGVSDEPLKDKKPAPHKGESNYPQAWLNPTLHNHDNEVLQQAAATLKTQVAHSFAAMRDGAPLAAMGELSACQWCAVRGLCRKGYTFGENP